MHRSQPRLRRALPAGAAAAVLATILATAPGAGAALPGPLSVNEFSINHVGTDSFEYVELLGTPSADYSSASIVAIEGQAASSRGQIERVLPIGTTDADGRFTTPFLVNQLENDTVTLLVVEGLTASVGTDLDTNDDGILDVTPWASLADSVAVRAAAADLTYSDDVLAADFDGGSNTVGGASRLPDGTGAWVRNDFDGAGLPGFTGVPGPGEAANTPGAPNSGGSTGGDCDAAAQPVGTIQGDGAASPLAGQVASVSGVVVTHELLDGLNGFYAQDPVADPLGTASSDGIFVYAPFLTSGSVSVGDVVDVCGPVSEFGGQTQLSPTGAAEVDVTGTATLPSPTPLTLPATPAQRESLEGMLVSVAGTLTVTENFNQARYGELLLAAGGRLSAPTEEAAPGAAAQAVATSNAARSILLDDGSNAENRDPVPYLRFDGSEPYFPADGSRNTLRVGDEATGVVGVLGEGFGAHRVQPTAAPTFTRVNDRPAAPAPGGDLQVAAFNVLNYFNGDGLGGGFPTSRGANTAAELDRQRAKVVAALVALDADVVGLIEIENDGSGPTSAIADLVGALNAAQPDRVYAAVDPGVPAIGTDEIAVGFIYDTVTTTLAGGASILDSADDPRFVDTLNRPSLAQTFDHTGSGERLTVTVNHLKSKGSACAGDPDTGDGQGNCNVTRQQATAALVDWLASDPTGSGDPDHLVIGDLNAYRREDPITTLTGAGYTLLDQGHSYVFQGGSGALDHALASPSLATKVTDALVWHINADEPRVLDYNVEFKTPGQVVDLFSPGPYRSSDHDPIVVGVSAPTAGATYPGLIDLIGSLESAGELDPGTASLLRNLAQGAQAWAAFFPPFAGVYLAVLDFVVAFVPPPWVSATAEPALLAYTAQLRSIPATN